MTVPAPSDPSSRSIREDSSGLTLFRPLAPTSNSTGNEFQFGQPSGLETAPHVSRRESEGFWGDFPYFALLAVGWSAPAAIFGTDTRVQLEAGSRLARSTAIAVLSSLYEETAPGRLQLDVSQLENICKDEPFSADPSLSYSCTGFLVAPNLIATAGHCMVNTGEDRNETETYCQAFSWLFDYAGGVNVNTVSKDNLYRCKQVVYAIREEVYPFRDFALVQLDRDVKGRQPFQLSGGPLLPDERLKMVGYPFGTPAKLSVNGKILLDNPVRPSFITNLDAFEGNSGSPVLNSDGQVVGVLVAGTPSISLFTPAGQTCQRYNQCDENGENCAKPDPDTSVFPEFQRTGSEVERIDPIIKLVLEFGLTT